MANNWIQQKYDDYTSIKELKISKRIIEDVNCDISFFEKKPIKIHNRFGTKYEYYVKNENIDKIPKEYFIFRFSGYKLCVDCGKYFPYFERKTKNICHECKTKLKPCICGCGKLTGSTYVIGHHLKGKTYKEIHGDKDVKCGYQKGDKNISKLPEIREKISIGVKKSYTSELLAKRKEHFNKHRASSYSKISQELFFKIFNRLSEDEKGDIYFFTLNKELKLQNNETNSSYYPDFIDLKTKSVIEFYGDIFHGNPLFFKENDTPHPYDKKISAKDLWLRDQLRKENIEKMGYSVKIIWDYDYNENKENTVSDCLTFIRRGVCGNNN